MAQLVAYHFHGYQPGDLVRRLPTSPTKPMAWEDRRSPVELSVGDRRLVGDNWTDCMLHCYDAFLQGLGGLAADLGDWACSVDIEPFTLEMLLAKDRREGRDIFGGWRAAVDKGFIDPVVTTPFHPFLPYLHPFEQEVLAHLAFDVHGLPPRARGGPPWVTGIWLSEGGYTREVAGAMARAFWDTHEAATHEVYFLLDGRQFIEPHAGYGQWSLNFLDLGLAKPAYVFGRDVEVSDAYSFGSRSVEELVDMIVYDRLDVSKEDEGIPYVITLASDLEALVGNPAQMGRFQDLMKALHGVESFPTTHGAFVRGKVKGTLGAWEGEGRAEGFRAIVKEYSSWSDYFDHAVGGHTGDTRWQGMRRVDGLVISRMHRGRRISQVWKQGLLAVEARVEAAVRRGFGAVVRAVAPGVDRDQGRAFLVAYGRLILQNLYLRQGTDPSECTFDAAMDPLGSVRDPEALALAGRAYYEMLMGLRSDPCFWENPDTRVTFQNVVMLTHALVDMTEALERVDETALRERLLRVLQSHLLEFESVYHLYRLGTLSGRRGWETTEDAWVRALQSEAPELSSYDVVRRATLYALRGEAPGDLAMDYDAAQVTAATGHIEGEGHGHWGQPNYCEHREGK